MSDTPQGHDAQFAAPGLSELPRVHMAFGWQRQPAPHTRQPGLDEGADDHVGAGGGVGRPVLQLKPRACACGSRPAAGQMRMAASRFWIPKLAKPQLQ